MSAQPTVSTEVFHAPQSQERSWPTVFLHGFPGVRSKQNREIAKAVSERTGRDAHVLLYSGINDAPGLFSFESCLAEVHAYIESLRNQGITRFDLVGHSWGGFLALTLASKYPDSVRKLVLMSPLLKFHPVADAFTSFSAMQSNYPEFKFHGVQELASEFFAMNEKFPTDQFIEKLPRDLPVLFLQAEADEVTPTKVAQSKLELFPNQPEFTLAKTDHSFLTNREWTVNTISNFLNR